MQRGRWVEKHAADVLISLERDVFPKIGTLPVWQITPLDLLGVLREVEKRDAKETAKRLRQRISSVAKYAIIAARGEVDPAAALGEALLPIKRGRQPAITDLGDARTLNGRSPSPRIR
ncbi:hypothetical protein [Enterovirga sp.]|uniref:tyrosine-type recombinase/integrase n=1 Tax=Enterovirga sp. TaxID=2026350 RepID=UPI002626BC54|nr:hypothetical protein [Enterovirga sp.]MDB5592662.1 integrase [Enterovirga sp.]